MGLYPKATASQYDRFNEPCLYRTGKAMAQGALMGFFAGATMLAWYPDPYRYDHKGVVVPKALNLSWFLRGMKAPLMWPTAICGVFSMTECVVEQLRDEKKESTHWNAAIGGAAAGMVMGSISKRVDIMGTCALGVGLLLGLIEFNGQNYISDEAHTEKVYNERIPLDGEKESDTIKALKEKYPEFKHL